MLLPSFVIVIVIVDVIVSAPVPPKALRILMCLRLIVFLGDAIDALGVRGLARFVDDILNPRLRGGDDADGGSTLRPSVAGLGQ